MCKIRDPDKHQEGAIDNCDWECGAQGGLQRSKRQRELSAGKAGGAAQWQSPGPETGLRFQPKETG